MEPVMTAEEIVSLLDEHYPQINFGGGRFKIECIESMKSVVRLKVSDLHLRPGGTVSGPSLMELVDLGAYVVVLAHIGPEVMAVTANLNISFLKRPNPGDLICESHLIKLGRRLVIVDCTIKSEPSGEAVAKSIITYSVPSKERA